MKFKKLLILGVIPLMASCGETDSSSDVEPSSEDASSIISSSEETPISSEESSSSSSSSSSIWSENEITLKEADALVEKAKSFKNTNKIEYYQKGNSRYEKTEYKRYENFYTLEGECDSYLDAWDQTNLIGYVGFPSDGSINCFYDTLKADVGTQHAKYYSINDNPTKETELSEEEALEKLDNYENNLSNFMSETYYLLRKDKFGEYINKGSLRAERKDVEGKDTLHIFAEKDYTYLYKEYHAEYNINININSDGSFSMVDFDLNDAGYTTKYTLSFEYGDFFDASSLDEIFNPELYFSKKLDINFTSIYAPKGSKNTLTVGSAAYLIPHQDYMPYTSDFTYLPSTAVDYWDINVLSSDNEEVISYSETDGCFVANKPGKANLTVGNIYNPYCTTTVEVEVIYSSPSEILAHTPYNQSSYVGEAFTNADVLLDVEVGPYGAEKGMIVSSSDEDIATVYVNENNEVMVHGKKEGYVTITVSSEVDPTITRSFDFHVVGELTNKNFAGTWEDNSYYSTYKMKFSYTFNEDGSGQMVFTALDSYGKEQVNTVPMKYILDASTQTITITPIGWTVQEDLLSVHYYTGEYLKTHFTYGEYYFSINLSRVKE